MDAPAPPTWTRTEAGRLEPFDAGRLRRSLFAATVAIGAPDPFLARELADGVVHFLAEEYDGSVPTLAQIADVTAKVVRELGHPALAVAYEGRRARLPEHGPYSPDVRAAHDAGLLRIHDIDEPSRLAAYATTLDRLRESRALVVALEGGGDIVGEVRRAGVRAVVNLNAEGPSAGPLFGATERESPSLSDLILGGRDVLLAVNWHVQEGDGLEDILPWLGHGVEVGFVPRYPRRPVPLGLGLTRDGPAILTRVGLGLPALANQPGLLADVDRFLLRVGTLARLAVDAGEQKRAHLRREGGLSAGFLLERARFVAVAEGLDEVVRLFTNWGLANGGPSLELGRRIVGRLREVLRQEGRAVHLETHLEANVTGGQGMCTEAQIRAGADLHALADGGTLHVHLPEGEPASSVLREAWRQGVCRVVLG